MVIISPARRIAVMSKTNCTCSMCGSNESVVTMPFIPKWTRVDYTNRDNLIPVCKSCYMKYADTFIELNVLNNLSKMHVEELMRYYMSWSKYLYKYNMLFHDSRCASSQTKNEVAMVIESYDLYVRENINQLQWEEL